MVVNLKNPGLAKFCLLTVHPVMYHDFVTDYKTILATTKWPKCHRHLAFWHGDTSVHTHNATRKPLPRLCNSSCGLGLRTATREIFDCVFLTTRCSLTANGVMSKVLRLLRHTLFRYTCTRNAVRSLVARTCGILRELLAANRSGIRWGISGNRRNAQHSDFFVASPCPVRS